MLNGYFRLDFPEILDNLDYPVNTSHSISRFFPSIILSAFFIVLPGVRGAEWWVLDIVFLSVD